MKKLLLLAGFLIGTLAHSQDVSYLQKLKALPSEADALKVANEIVSFSKVQLRLYQTIDSPTQKNLRYVFAPANLSDKEISGRTYDQVQANVYTTVDFVYFNEGENVDLEKTGIKKYRLSTVQATYLNLFPFWKEYFNPSADTEKTLTDYKSQHVKDVPNAVNYYIQKQGNSWVLKNQS